MKKLLLLTAIVTMLSLGASAQRDGFFSGDDGGNDQRAISGSMPLLPRGNIGSTDNDQPATAPIGSGLLILSALGGAYLLRRSQK